MSHPKHSTIIADTPKTFPMLCFHHKYYREGLSQQKDMITSELTLENLAMARTEDNKGTYSAERNEILDDPDKELNKCRICTKTSNQKRDVVGHNCIQAVKNQSKCSVYEKRISQESHLHRYEHTYNGVETCECAQCAQNVTNHLAKKQNIHTGEKPPECLERGDKFLRNDALAKQQLVHTDEKPYNCLECGNKFSWKSHLAQHLSIHTGQTPYECLECGKKFSRNDHLTQHKVIHTGEKP